MTATDACELPRNAFRSLLQRRRPVIGIWSMLNSTNAVEGLAYAGFDWILIDGEHSPVSLHDAIGHLRVLEGTPTVPIVRLVWNDKVLLKQYLDAGATTIMLPYVETAEEAAAAVAAMRYPPRGRRGVAVMHRASRYGRIRNYCARADEELYLIVQVETREAVANIEQIAAVDGVDALFFGPGDLAASLGHTGQADHPEVTALIGEALGRARRTGKAVGVLAPTAALAESHLRAGFDFVSVANDCALLFKGADAVAARCREIVSPIRSGAAEPG
jgi:4-hydroxy-2-oxoheptanedioate aldolase